MSFVWTLSIFAAICLAFYLYQRRATRIRRDAKPPVTVADVDRAMQRLMDAALPIAKITTLDGMGAATGSRLGGQPWAPSDDADWPQDDEGRPLFFLAQINFADLTLPDYPTAGLLQVFAAWHTAGLPDMSDGQDGNLTMRWFETPQGGGVTPVPDVHRDKKMSMFASERARLQGVGLKFESGTAPGNPYSWPFEAFDSVEDLFDRHPADAAAKDRVFQWEADQDAIVEGYGAHWVGGHASFTQNDIRHGDEDLQTFDRVLLHIGFDDDVCLGDAGQLNVMIRNNDLRAKRFGAALLTWDCY